MALKGGQKKLDKNKDGKITGADFALMRKSGYKMGGEFKVNDSDRMTKRDIKIAEKSARVLKDAQKILDSDRMTQRDIDAASRAVGKQGGGVMDYYSETSKVNKDNLDRAGKGVGSMIERILVPPVGAIRDTGKAYKEFKKMQKRKQNKKDVEQIEAKSGKFIDRRKELGGLSDDKKDSKFLERRLKLSKKKSGGVMKAKSGDLADTMKKLRKRAYEKSMKKNKKVGRFGDDEYLIQKPLPGMKKGKMIKAKTGKYVFDMIAVKPMSGLNKNKKKDGFLDDVFEKTVKKYGLKDPTKKK